MTCPRSWRFDPSRDPIDVVTGAFFDEVRDFVVHAALQIAFNRTYSTERVAVRQ